MLTHRAVTEIAPRVDVTEKLIVALLLVASLVAIADVLMSMCRTPWRWWWPGSSSAWLVGNGALRKVVAALTVARHWHGTTWAWAGVRSIGARSRGRNRYLVVEQRHRREAFNN